MDRFSSSSCLFPDVEKVSSGDPGMAHLKSGGQRRVGQIIILEKYYVIFLFVYFIYFCSVCLLRVYRTLYLD